MSLIAKDLPTLVFMLLPGFMAAGVFYTLTSHPKSSEFERLIQALIFTTILKFFTSLVRFSLIGMGTFRSFGTWNAEVELLWSISFAVPLGLTFAWLANSDQFHQFARARKWSSRTSYPSEWYGAFARETRWLVLHLNDGRRIFGWPEEWPDQPDKGHFILNRAEWLLQTQERAPMVRVEQFMLPASEVKMVEFLSTAEEVEKLYTPEQIEISERLLRDLQPRESTDGVQSISTDSGSTG